MMIASERQAAIDAFSAWLDENAVFNADGVRHRKQDQFTAWITQGTNGLYLVISYPEHVKSLRLEGGSV